MIYHPLTAEQKPYDVRIWHCDGFKEHWHSNMDIYVCLQGQLDIRVEGADHHLTPGDTLFVASNEIHEIFCRRTDTYVLLISFGYSLLGQSYGALQSVCFDRPFSHLADRTVPDEIRIPLEQIRTLLQSPDPDAIAADWALCSCLYAIAAYLSKHSHSFGVSKERLLRTRQLSQLQETLRYISRHYREPITLTQAAAAAGYDTSYFCKLFRSATGMTFHRYLNEYRISVVCQLLTETEDAISVVAEKAGFPSQKKLNRLFRDIMGTTPTQYRKQRTLRNTLHS